MFSNTFAGIASLAAPAYIGAQVIGGLVAVEVIKALYPRMAESAANVVVPHDPAAVNGTTTPAGGKHNDDQLPRSSHPPAH
jgi:hypothetical protein